MKDPEETKNELVVAVVWYRPEQWQRIRDIATDVERFEDSYLEWLRQAEDKVNDLRSTGVRVEKVDLDSEKLILWCNERGLENDGEARTRYAAELLAESDKKRSLTQGDK